MKNKAFKTFLRSFYLSSVVVFCLIFALYGISEAYKNIRRIGFGEYRNAIEIGDGKLEILDFEWEYHQ
jgi:hypothetical protein